MTTNFKKRIQTVTIAIFFIMQIFLSQLVYDLPVAQAAGEPDAPTGVSATYTGGHVALTWNSSTGANSYNVYRSVFENRAYAKVNSSAILGTTYQDNSTLLSNGTYYYRITAVNTNGESKKSSFSIAVIGSGIGTLNTANPTTTPRLIFIHHSTGRAWLNDGWGNLGLTLSNNNYYVSDTDYAWGPSGIGDSTDLGHWYTWFRSPNSSTYLSALYIDSGEKASYTRLSGAAPTGENEIIMFKSCFPNSNLGGSINNPVPSIASNPMKGQGVNVNYKVENAKGIYIDLLEYFKTRQDKLFIAVTAPPLISPTTPQNARDFNNWLVNEWLLDYPYNNVVVFDYYNVLTSNNGNENTNDFGLSTGNHHRYNGTTGRIDHLVNNPNNTASYPHYDDHPSAAGDQKATGEYTPILNIAYNNWKENAALPANTVPTLIANTGLTATQNGASVTVTSAMLSVSDAEQAAAALTYTIGTAPTKGTLRKNGANLSTAGTFTQDDINTNKITYLPPASQNGTDSFTFTVSDGAGGTLSSRTFNITINPPANTAPTLAANTGLFSVQNGAGVVITSAMLSVSDAEQAASALTYTIGTATTKGTLKKSGVDLAVGGTFTQDDINTSKITYTPPTSQNGSDSFTFTVSDGAGGTISSRTFNITINPPVNTVPTLTVNAGLTATQNGTQVTITIAILNVNDAEQATTALTYTIETAPTKGTLRKSGVSLAAGNTFTQDDINTNKITYTPPTSQSGVDSFTFTVSDGAGGTITTRSFNITINPPTNTDPTLTVNAGLTSTQNGTQVTITIAMLSVSDAEQAATALTYTIGTAPTKGTLRKSGANLSAGSTFTQDDINTGKITYLPPASQSGSDSFTFAVNDGAEGTLSSRIFNITINPPVNTVPTISLNTGLTATQNGTNVTVTNVMLSASDTEQAATALTYTIGTAPTKGALKKSGVNLAAGGTFSQDDINTGKITYLPPTSQNGADSFTFTVNDGAGGTTTTRTFNVTINPPINTVPTITVNAGLTATQNGTSVTVTSAKLSVSDAEQAATALTYTIGTAPIKGTLRKSGANLCAGSTFTQDDINTSKITYLPPASQNGADSFTFTVNDGAGGTTTIRTFSITIEEHQESSGGSGGGGSGGSSSSSDNTSSTQSTEYGSVLEKNDTITANIDIKKISKIINSQPENSSIIISTAEKTDEDIKNAIFNFDGNLISELKEKDIVVTSSVGNYSLPISAISNDELLKQEGISDISKVKMSVEISTTQVENVKLDGVEIVGQPIKFEVKYSVGNKKGEIKRFSNYVGHEILVPEDKEFTTMVTIESDGKLRQIPTKIILRNGKRYAVGQSMTNSVYALINKEVEFNDIRGHWAKDTIDNMAEKLITSGEGDNRFIPDMQIERAEFATMLVRALGLSTNGNSKFTDVSIDKWYYGPVTVAADYEIITGYGNGKFGPNDKVTREQAAVMIVKAMELAAKDENMDSGIALNILDKFKDSKEFSEWSVNNIAVAVKAGIVRGSNERFFPKNNLTRAEAATMIENLLKKIDFIN